MAVGSGEALPASMSGTTFLAPHTATSKRMCTAWGAMINMDIVYVFILLVEKGTGEEGEQVQAGQILSNQSLCRTGGR